MKRQGPPSIITVAIITTITIIFWIFFGVYQILTGEVAVDVPQQLLKPINPTLNQEVLSELNGKTNFQKDSVTHFSVGTKINIDQESPEEETPTITPTVTPVEDEPGEAEATPSSELSQQ